MILPLFFGLLILLIPSQIADERPEAERPAAPHPGPAPLVKHPMPRLPTRSFRDFDREQFRAAFARQSGSELVPCLKSALGPRGSVTFLARLEKTGKLSAVRVLASSANAVDAKGCVHEAVQKMEFAALALELKADSLELEWLFEW